MAAQLCVQHATRCAQQQAARLTRLKASQAASSRQQAPGRVASGSAAMIPGSIATGRSGGPLAQPVASSRFQHKLVNLLQILLFLLLLSTAALIYLFNFVLP